MRPGDPRPDEPQTSGGDEPRSAPADTGAGGSSSGASVPGPARRRDDEPSEGAGETEIPLGTPIGADELRRLKRAAQEKEETPDGGTPDEGADPGADDPDSEDEG